MCRDTKKSKEEETSEEKGKENNKRVIHLVTCQNREEASVSSEGVKIHAICIGLKPAFLLDPQ